MELDWKTIKSTEIHRNPWYRLLQDDVVMPSGQQGKYTYIDRLPAVVIAAMTPEEENYLVGQFRYPIKKFSWELPKGAIERADVDLLEAAKTELLEEVGLAAEDWQSLGSYYLDVALTNQAAHLFLARKLSQKKSSPDFTEFLTSKKIKLDELEKMIAENQIYDSSTISAYFKLKIFLQANDK